METPQHRFLASSGTCPSPVTPPPFQSAWQPSALEAERPKQMWLVHYLQSADSTLCVGWTGSPSHCAKFSSQETIQKLRERGSSMHLDEKYISISTLSPFSIHWYKKPLKKRAFFMSSVVVHLSLYCLIPPKYTQESNSQISCLSHGWN